MPELSDGHAIWKVRIANAKNHYCGVGEGYEPVNVHEPLVAQDAVWESTERGVEGAEKSHDLRRNRPSTCGRQEFREKAQLPDLWARRELG